MKRQTRSHFLRIAPDRSRPLQTLRIKYSLSNPAHAPIRRMLQEVQMGQLAETVADALRFGAALELRAQPLRRPTVQTPARSYHLREEFARQPRKKDSHPDRDELWTRYDPRLPHNEHLEIVFGRCEWGETNATMLRMLLLGLVALEEERVSRLAQDGTQQPQSAAVSPGVPSAPITRVQDQTTTRTQVEAATEEGALHRSPTALPRDDPGVLTIGVDPTRVNPQTPTRQAGRTDGASALLHRTAKRAPG